MFSVLMCSQQCHLTSDTLRFQCSFAFRFNSPLSANCLPSSQPSHSQVECIFSYIAVCANKSKKIKNKNKQTPKPKLAQSSCFLFLSKSVSKPQFTPFGIISSKKRRFLCFSWFRQQRHGNSVTTISLHD